MKITVFALLLLCGCSFLKPTTDARTVVPTSGPVTVNNDNPNGTVVFDKPLIDKPLVDHPIINIGKGVESTGTLIGFIYGLVVIVGILLLIAMKINRTKTHYRAGLKHLMSAVEQENAVGVKQRFDAAVRHTPTHGVVQSLLGEMGMGERGHRGEPQ